jgi:AcrR family transcriptional regulator
MSRLHGSRSTDAKRAELRAKNAPRKQPMQARSKTMVESILRATARILVREGYAALTTNGVAEEAGASVGSLYQYFPSKESLVAALLDRHIEDTLGPLRRELPALSLLPIEQAVPRFVELMIATHQIEPELHRVFVEQLPRIGDFVKIDSGSAEAQRLARAYLAAHAAELTPDDHELTAFMLVHSVEAMTHAAVSTRPDLLKQPYFVSEIAAMIIAYLKRGGVASAQ